MLFVQAMIRMMWMLPIDERAIALLSVMHGGVDVAIGVSDACTQYIVVLTNADMRILYDESWGIRLHAYLTRSVFPS